jgi:hypothetical protein
MRTDRLLIRAGGAAILAGLVAVLAVGAFAADAAAGTAGIPCLVEAATGLACPLCGMTHATLAVGAGDLGAAFAAHPLFWLVLGFAAWGGQRLARGRDLAPVTLQRLLVGVAVVWAANLVAQFAHG